VIRSRANRPHWALEEIGTPYTYYQLDFTKGDHRSENFLKMNPAGKMPVLVDGDLVLSESGAICNYLGEKFPESKLTPPSGTHDRAHYDQWMMFVLTELEQPLWTNGKHRFALPEAWRVPRVLETATFEFARAADVLSKGLGQREFLVGNSFTMADILAAHTLRWAVVFEFELAHDNLSAYLARMESRPAFARMREAKTRPFPR
jgi:glutathione S-transferase